MSMKSRNRAYKNRNQRSAPSPLNSQKQALKLNMFYCLASSVGSFALNILGIIVVFRGENARQILILSIFEMIFAVTFIHCFIAFGRRFKIYRQLHKIQFSTEQLVPIHCKKISFLYKPVSKHFSSIICIIIVDEYGNKFYYVYPKEGPSEFANKFIKQQCLGKHLELNCYKNTYMIKTLFI